MTRKKVIKKQYSDLTPRRKDFCRFYVIEPNGEKAAIKAGFATATAAQEASRLLNNVKVSKEIDRLRKEREKRLEASADFVIRELMRIAKFDIRLAYDKKSGKLLDIASMPEDIAKCIAGVEVFEEFMGRGAERELIGYTRKVKAWDKVKALDLLAQHFGLLRRPTEDEPTKEKEAQKISLLQSIKILSSKDGSATIIENRIGSNESSPDGVDRPVSRSFQVL